MTRYDANMVILNTLKEYLEKYPELRFGQALIAMGIVEQREVAHECGDFNNSFWKDDFYTESEEILQRIK